MNESQAITAVVTKIAEIIPRCEATGKVIHGAQTAPLTAKRLSQRHRHVWVYRKCEQCGGVHIWRVA